MRCGFATGWTLLGLRVHFLDLEGRIFMFLVKNEMRCALRLAVV